MTTVAQILADQAIPRTKSASVHNLLDSDLRCALDATASWVSPAIDTLAAGLPLPRSVAPFVDRPFFRPPGSNRCFYYCPSTIDGPNTGPGVLAIKGLEPCTEDFDALVRDLDRACYTQHNIAEHFVFVEHKIPACLGLQEALREANRATAVQRAHLRVYGELARLPLPLLALHHTDEIIERAREALRNVLQTAAFLAIEPTLNEGLATYVYYYPSPAIRACDIDYRLQGLGFRERLLALIGHVGDPERIVRHWVRGFVRMLYLGYLPGSLASLRSGICCQPQNACIDGGFVDLGSVTPLPELRSESAVPAALQFCLEALLDTVRTLIAGASDPTRVESLEIRIDLHYIRQYLFALIEEAIETEARPQLALDRRIQSYLTSPRTLACLVTRLGTYYSRPTQLDAVPPEYAALAPELIRSARES
jgi:hypothetical protein